jgi:hypothetical protein
MANTQTASADNPVGIAVPPQYDPTNPTPYSSSPDSATPPPIVSPPPNPLAQQPAPTAPAVLPNRGGRIAGIAYGLDSILRGFMKGRDFAQQKQAYNLSKLMQGYQWNIKQNSDEYLGILQNNPETAAKLGQLLSGKSADGKPLTPDDIKAIESDPNVIKAQQADAKAYSSWVAQQTLYNNYINPQKKSKSGKSKGGDSSGQGAQGGENPIELLQSQNPQDKAKGYLLLSQKIGPPWRREAAYMMSPQYQQAVRNAQGQQTLDAGNTQDKIDLRNLETTDTSKMSPEEKAAHEQKMNALRDRISETASGFSQKMSIFDKRTGPDNHQYERYKKPDGTITDWVDVGEVRAPASEVVKPGTPQAFIEEWGRENGYEDAKTIPAEVQRQLHQAFSAPGRGSTVRNGQVIWTDANGNSWRIPIQSTTTRTTPAMPKAVPPAWAPGAKLENSTAGVGVTEPSTAKPHAAASSAVSAAPAAGTPAPPVKGAEFLGKKSLTPEEKLQNAIRAKDHTAAKKVIDDAKKDYNGALIRVDTMDKNLKAALNGDQQAMLSLVANHIGMTLGAQKGARITRAVWDEAVESAPWLQVKINKWFHDDPATGDKVFDGYKSGVTLTPEQMQQMVTLAHEKVDTLKKDIPVLEQLYKSDLAAAPPSGNAGQTAPTGPHAVDSILDEKFGKPQTQP